MSKTFSPEAVKRLRQETAVTIPGFGNLSRPDSVVINAGRSYTGKDFQEDDSLIINLAITGRCYARCKGCINAAVTLASDSPRNLVVSSQETVPQRDAATIRKLVSGHPGKTATICFYGGEPFLATGKMEETRKILNGSPEGKRFRYMVYTNGEQLLPALENFPELMQEMWLYSFSVDGREEQHRRARPGTSLPKIHRNLSRLRRCCRGTVLLWSTLREEQSLLDCFEEFTGLFQEGLVDHFFWHWVETEEPFTNLTAYLKRYQADLVKVMDAYVREAGKNRILPIGHISELVLYLISGRKRGSSACGVELAENYDIINGRICACADLPPDLGNVSVDRDGKLRAGAEELAALVKYKESLDCYECGVHDYCGGRCPVQALTGSPERTLQYCQLMRLHVGVVKDRIPEIKKALKRHGITLQNIYDQSAFIARYTDVTP
jgi:uncharacterized protein